MDSYFVVIIAVGFVAIFMVFNSFMNAQKLKRDIRFKWGKPPAGGLFDKIDSVSNYWIEKADHEHLANYIDDITWNDLNMEEVYKRLNSTNSSVGAEYLYARLHEPDLGMKDMNDLEQLIESMDERDDIREKIQFRLARLGKNDHNMVWDFIFSPQDKKLKNDFIYPILASLPVVSTLIMIINFRYGILMLIASLITNVAVYYKNKYKLAVELEAVSYITSIIVCGGKLIKLKDDRIQPYLKKIESLYKPLKKIAGWGSVLLSKPKSELEFLYEYIKIVFLLDYNSYNKIVSIIYKKNELFHQLWQEIGKIDTAISIASYRRSIGFYTIPVFTNSNDLVFEDLYHPLISNPECNTGIIAKGSIITGSNASGKSTFVKSVAINCIFAETIHTCLATSFCLKPSRVVSSMAVTDNVVQGDSYYIAEIKSLKRILDMINDDVHCVCFIDEILKGTNTIERIAASAAILSYLSGQNCLCLVASHDIELTEMLKNIYDNYHFRERITDEGITFDYKLHTGHATTRNAIKLLEFMDYPENVVGDAKSAAEGFEESHKWKSYN